MSPLLERGGVIDRMTPQIGPLLREFIVVDLFCGAGGASQGLLRCLERLGLTPDVLRARGWRLRLININHWEIAIETIRRNIAFAEMYNASIENVDPNFVLQGQRPHLLIAAAECIMFSSARGDKPIRDQSRTTAAWILDWVKCKPYSIYFENVPEWRSWGKLDEKMRPIPEHKGEYYDAFLRKLRKTYGYNIAEGVVNCSEHGDATSRKRLFIVGLAKDVASSVSLPTPTHTTNRAKFPDRLPARTARQIIDWKRKGEPITHRERGPHAAPTLRRIRAGYAKQDAILRPVILELIDRLIPIATEFHQRLDARPTEGKVHRKLTKDEKAQNNRILKSARAEAEAQIRAAYDSPLGEFNTADMQEYEREAFAFVLGQHGGAVARPVDQPLPTIASGGAIGLATIADGLIVKANASEKSAFADGTQPLDIPLRTIVTKDCRALAAPTLAVVQHGENDERTPNINAPLPTQTGKGSTGLAQPVIAQLYSSNLKANGPGGVDSVDQPLSTVTAGGVHQALVEPMIATVHGTKGTENRCHSTDEPITTIGAGGKQHALAEAIITSRNNAQRGDRRAHGIDEPIPTATRSGAGYLAEPFIIPQQAGKEARSVDLPVPTVTTIARQGLAQAHVTSNHHDNAGVSINEPLPTTTTASGGGMGIAQPFIVPNFGERPTQAPRVHALDEPVPTITSHGAGALVDIILPEDGPYFLLDGYRVSINILYRMLHSLELAGAHSLENVSFCGSEADAVKQIGNSIPRETAAAMIGQVIVPVLVHLGERFEAIAA